MGNLAEAFKETIDEHEGWYANDSDDLGGETIRGIARVYHPNWIGWRRIDELKAQGKTTAELINPILKADMAFNQLVLDFYRTEFWLKIRGEDVPQDIALELFDSAVHASPSRAIEWLQQALNYSNRNMLDYPDIDDDGAFGSTTMGTLKLYLSKNRNNCMFLVNVMNIIQGAYYLERMKKNSSQEKYRGWFSRVVVRQRA